MKLNGAKHYLSLFVCFYDKVRLVIEGFAKVVKRTAVREYL